MSAMSSLKVAVIGVGIIGRTLATRFASAGHAVSWGIRDCHPRKDEFAQFAERIGAQLTGIGAAIDSSRVVIFAIERSAMPQTVTKFGARMGGVTVIDATNNPDGASINSLALIAEHAPDARIYRAFNSVGRESLVDAGHGDTVIDMPYSGPAGGSQHQVEALICAAGLRPVWVGDNDKAEIVDGFVTL